MTHKVCKVADDGGYIIFRPEEDSSAIVVGIRENGMIAFTLGPNFPFATADDVIEFGKAMILMGLKHRRGEFG